MRYSIDSRTVIDPVNTIFYAIVGKNRNGHDYVLELYNRGVRNFVVSQMRDEFAGLSDAAFRVVEDTLKAFQQDAGEYARGIDAQMVAITGSNGKTVVKEWISQLMEWDVKLCRSPRSYNSQVGVPLSLFEIDPSCDVALIEAGISLPGEMEILEKIIAPDVAIFTHFGDAHNEGFSSEEEKLREKGLLFRNCKVAIAHKDKYGEYISSVLPQGAKMIFWGESSGVDVRAELVEKTLLNRTVRVTEYLSDSEGVSSEITIPFADDASYENCMTAICYLLYRAYPLTEISSRVRNLQQVAMRMEIKDGVYGSIIIKDYYNSDLASFSLAIRSLSVQGAQREKTVILSDFVGVGDDLYYQRISELLQEEGVDVFVGIGEKLCGNAAAFRGLAVTRFYKTTEEFLKLERREFYKNQVILIKGARRFKFEQIGAFLQKQSHTTMLEVDLDAIAHNFNLYKKKVAPETRMAVMVKAFSYGSGLAEVASILQYNGVDYLMVAYTDEGVELRSKGVTVPIAVMNPERESFDQMIEFALEPEIYSMELLDTFERYLVSNGIREYPIHLKLNTGMNRSGLNKNEIPQLLDFFKFQRSSKIVSLFSHLATADDPAQDGFTLEQISLFEECAEMIVPKFDHKILRHILNSAGIERFPQFCFDMVRLGIGLYGVGGDSALECVSTFKTHITSIREISEDETVGYGRKGRVMRPAKIATIPVGYADGIDRRLSCGVGEMFTGGRRVPIVGNVCMDICMLDVTDCDVRVGDEVEIFGKNISVGEIAQKLGTIEYEILTSVSRRVKRVYFKE